MGKAARPLTPAPNSLSSTQWRRGPGRRGDGQIDDCQLARNPLSPTLSPRFAAGRGSQSRCVCQVAPFLTLPPISSPRGQRQRQNAVPLTPAPNSLSSTQWRRGPGRGGDGRIVHCQFARNPLSPTLSPRFAAGRGSQSRCVCQVARALKFNSHSRAGALQWVVSS